MHHPRGHSIRHPGRGEPARGTPLAPAGARAHAAARVRRAALVPTLGLLLALLWLCAAASEASAQTAGAVAVGRAILFDPALSEPRGTSCASCHDPARAYAGDHGSGVGVPRGSRSGTLARRSTPSLLYLAYVPKFRFYRDDDERGVEAEPYGGFFWDGRADSIADLVRQPLLNPREMNNRDLAQIAEKLRRAPYADAFRREYPGALEGSPDGAVGALGAALTAFLTSPAMAPFSSRYDDFVRGTATLTPLEQQGLALFKDPARGGCAKCHTLNDASKSPELSMFTDYGYEAVGAPRNTRLRARDEDRGLCERADPVNPTDAVQYCVSFRTPSLRNVALRPAFMHNGAFTRLRDVVRFYATRATNPERWYPSGAPFDDTPAAYRGLIDTTSVPYRRARGDAPAFTEGEIDALVAFLGTLTDRKL
jgi:cytochrome c peroxidase